MKHVLLRHYEVLITVSRGCPSVKGRLPTRYSPVRRFPFLQSTEASIRNFSLDLHVLGTPPAFILSQDQTLNEFYLESQSPLDLAQKTLLRFLCFRCSRNHCFFGIVRTRQETFLLLDLLYMVFRPFFCTMEFSRFLPAFVRQLY